MSSYYSKGLVNRHWKRPKPRVYECNVRDAERFYQQSYKDYQEAKEYAAKRALDDRSRISDDSSSSSRWGIRRSTSLLDPDSTNAFDSNSRSSYLNSSSSSNQYGDDSTFRTTASATSRNADGEMSSMEDRLQRIQKLRVELGLPTESNGSSGSTSKVTFLSPTSPTSSISKPPLSPDPRERRERTVEASSFSLSNGSSRSRALDSTSDSYGSQLSSDTERSSRFASKYSNNDDAHTASSFKSRQNGRASSYTREDPPESKYSLKSSLKKERRFESSDNDYSYKPKASKSSGESVTFKTTRKAASAINDDDDCDADAYLSNIKKKFPTSDEILERIKKMDSDM